ncbi:MAG TPA: adenylate/guanylate cyclase domain-containing protein [Stellaceae bacterium]|nr:adenylate/guanylate cyclase domain-containing protein [Stellaceae bacterium]
MSRPARPPDWSRCAAPQFRHVAVLFADLDHFTGICTEEPPRRVFALIRDFQSLVTYAVGQSAGRLNAFQGDGAMATFGDEAGRSDCASRALRCGGTILAHLAALHRACRRPVTISLGLQYGEVMSGVIPGSRRFGVTVIGDAINVANRLEQRAQGLRTEMVVGDDLVRKARTESGATASELARLDHLGPIYVDGRDRPVDVWTRPLSLSAAAVAPARCFAIDAGREDEDDFGLACLACLKPGRARPRRDGFLPSRAYGGM